MRSNHAVERLLLLAIAALGLALRAWNLDQNGWGAEYYSAAVRSMAGSWSNFLFCAFDPAGFISVDKPPVSLWVQVASVKLFGFHPIAVLLPQAIEGVACVLLLYFIVRPRFGAAAALLAALFLATTPILVAVNRTNNTDSALLLVLLLAAWALLDAAETGRRPRFLLAMALAGFAFNTKMLAGFIVLPAFFATYFVTAPVATGRRMADLALGSVVLVVISFSWVALDELTPPEDRPYVGSSTSNSMLQLVLGHNALSRFSLPEGSTRPPPATAAAADSSAAPDPDEAQPGLVSQRLFVRAPVGPMRLMHGQLAAQASWLLPLAVIAIVLGLLTPVRAAWSPQRRSIFFWLCWSATYIVVLSFAGGIVHYYYLAPLAAAYAVLAAVGFVQLWSAHRDGGPRAAWLSVALLATAMWQLFVQASALGWSASTLIHRGGWEMALLASLLAGVAICAAGLLLARRGGASLAAIGMASLLALPLAWSLSSVIVPGQGVLPSADLYRIEPAVMGSDDPRVRGNFGRSVDTAPLVEYLRAQRSSERFLLATTTTRIAAPIIIESGEPVMAMGGFHGLDGAMTPQGLAREIESGTVRFVMLNDAAAPSRRLGAEAALAPISDWVREHGRRIPGARWRSPSMPRGIALYDMKPGKEPR